MNKGLLHLYTGDGKGKTTAAMGLAFRALGCGKSVVVVQFLKGTPTGEVIMLKQAGVKVFREESIVKFVFQMTEQEKKDAQKKYNQLLQDAIQEPADLLILDEACAACELKMVEESLLQQVVLNRNPNTEVVLTGRNPANWMIEAADYYIEMKCHKHPYEQGIPARKGIEF